MKYKIVEVKDGFGRYVYIKERITILWFIKVWLYLSKGEIIKDFRDIDSAQEYIEKALTPKTVKVTEYP